MRCAGGSRERTHSFQSSSCAMTWFVKEHDITKLGWPAWFEPQQLSISDTPRW